VARPWGTEFTRLVDGVKVGMFGTTITVSGLVQLNTTSAELLLGLPFLRTFIVQIDYPNRRMRLLNRGSADLDKFANVEMRAQATTILPMIKVSVNSGREVWMTLDTGAGVGVFTSRHQAEKFGWLDDPLITRAVDGGAERLEIPYFKIGPFQLENVLVSVPAQGERTDIGGRTADSKGLIGYDVLKHFVRTLDTKKMKMHVGLPEEIKKEN